MFPQNAQYQVMCILEESAFGDDLVGIRRNLVCYTPFWYDWLNLAEEVGRSCESQCKSSASK